MDRRIAVNLGRLNGYVGVNNHMGSRFTASARDMRRVMVALRARDLLFLDSLTTGRSTGHGLAREFGIPTVVRDIFLDNDRAPASIRRQLARTVARARGHGHAIAIGHPYPETLDALESWPPRAWSWSRPRPRPRSRHGRSVILVGLPFGRARLDGNSAQKLAWRHLAGPPPDEAPTKR
ncbi:MAG: divergent polysaccharide deacetylase family protein [Alphaproteobacteria bacterium]|nr:divergent polysaccharide deacetylase family protein [Alphaproteobacteria bacterium]